jgi:hydrogenase maturation protein HypF
VHQQASFAGEPPHSERQGRRIEIRGTVQGVGFRPWVWRLARLTGISGRVNNDEKGVTIEAFGPAQALEQFVSKLRLPPPAAIIEEIHSESIAPQAIADFIIARSQTEEAAERRVSIPADLATCPDCLRELFDPGDRRYRYPFINCTQCGPRFTIARDVPYDRHKTTMASFAMCAECRREYEDPTDRRFHAQPNACPRCGPSVVLRAPEGEALTAEDPIAVAGRLLVDGRIVAVKGLGGYHLACDATSSEAVRRLRQRKHRDEKPFAVMARDLEGAQALGWLNNEELSLLTSVQRPVVLTLRRPRAGLADEVAPDNPLVGLFLPYTPLHHLLLFETKRPLVMTSGNLSEEPIAFDDSDALARLAPIADALLMHDRPIESPCDDSVTRVIAGQPAVFRRSRGYVPRAIRLCRPLKRPVLACGAHLKNTFCLAQGDHAYLGPHIGDLESLETITAYEVAIERMQRFVGIQPEVIAYDLHPDYASTRYALNRAEQRKVAVQHHHAHVVAAMAEHGLSSPVLGVAYDGTGLGPDGSAWGGEILRVDLERFERVATFRPIALAGGDLAVRQIWRVALALLDDAFDGEPPSRALALLREVPDGHIALIRRMIAQQVNSPLAHGIGRYFDGLAALGLGISMSRYEGQAALRWNLAADPAELGRYSFNIDVDAQPRQIDLRPMVREAVQELLAGRSAATVSARFHNTLVSATAEIVRAAARDLEHLPVVLTGGCFQNARLTESLVAELQPQRRVYLHRKVPSGDGGIALGQALVADAIARHM